MIKTLFVPGASGSAAFWQPVAREAALDGVFLAWPGLGRGPARAGVRSLDDLVTLAAGNVAEPVNIVAQSMGGVVAMRLTLMFPNLVKRLVLAITSGGVPVADLGGSVGEVNITQPFHMPPPGLPILCPTCRMR